MKSASGGFGNEEGALLNSICAELKGRKRNDGNLDRRETWRNPHEGSTNCELAREFRNSANSPSSKMGSLRKKNELRSDFDVGGPNLRSRCTTHAGGLPPMGIRRSRTQVFGMRDDDLGWVGKGRLRGLSDGRGYKFLVFCFT